MPAPVVFSRVVPILRIFDIDKARRFYLDYLGFTVDWEHRFSNDAPLYMQVSRGGMVLHLSEHHGDGTPGSVVYVETQGVRDFHAELQRKDYPYLNPGVDTDEIGTCMTLLDPFANTLRFNEPPREETDASGTKPIGYWLKHLDSLLEAAFDRALTGHAVNRRQWQALNVLQEAPRSEGELAEALLPFLGADAEPLGEVIGALEGRGWLTGDDQRRYALTTSGRAALEALARDVAGVRSRLSEGVAQAEYYRTIDVLARMATNLEDPAT